MALHLHQNSVEVMKLLQQFSTAMRELRKAATKRQHTEDHVAVPSFCKCGRCTNKSRALFRRCHREIKGVHANRNQFAHADCGFGWRRSPCRCQSVASLISCHDRKSQITKLRLRCDHNDAWEDTWNHNCKSPSSLSVVLAACVPRGGNHGTAVALDSAFLHCTGHS